MNIGWYPPIINRGCEILERNFGFIAGKIEKTWFSSKPCLNTSTSGNINWENEVLKHENLTSFFRQVHMGIQLVKNGYLIGGLEHEFYDFPYIGNVIIPTDFHIFQRDWNHQPDIV